MTIENITNCRACESKRIEKFFDLGEQPFANALLKNSSQPEKKYSLSLSYCHDCALVQLTETADPKELFSHYVWVTGTSSTTRQYAERFCDSILSLVGSFNQNEYVLEVASNDGTFLAPFTKRGVRVQGVDPAANIAEMANQNGIPTHCAFFGIEAAKEVVEKSGKPKVVLVRNVLPHVAALSDFLAGLEYCVDDESWLVLEVHHAQKILDELHYDSIYHEHLCYFSLHSLERLLKKYHFEVCKIGNSDVSGGSMVVYAKKQGGKNGKDVTVAQYKQKEIETGLNTFSSWQKFAEKSFQHRQKLLALLEKDQAQGKKIVGYGASARSSTMLNFCGIDAKYLSAVADQNPLKHDFYTPGTRIPIQSPEAVMAAKPDTIVVLAWNFFEEISKILKEKYQFKGSLIKPLPNDPQYLSNA